MGVVWGCVYMENSMEYYCTVEPLTVDTSLIWTLAFVLKTTPELRTPLRTLDGSKWCPQYRGGSTVLLYTHYIHTLHTLYILYYL